MIKLSRLGELLSIGDLIEKIESLENRMGSGVINVPDDPIDKKKTETLISEPESRWDTMPQVAEKPAQQVIQGKNKDKGWEGLLSYVSKSNKGMYAVVKDCKLIGQTDKTIEIERSNSPFSIRYLGDPENIEKLNNFCKEYYEKDIRVIITVPAAEEKKNEPEPVIKREIPQSVREVINVFKGELKENPTG